MKIFYCKLTVLKNYNIFKMVFKLDIQLAWNFSCSLQSALAWIFDIFTTELLFAVAGCSYRNFFGCSR